MKNADEWGPWVALRLDRAFPFRAGDYVRIRTFVDNKPFRVAEGFITDALIPEYVRAVACCRPGVDSIEVSVRRPRGLKMLEDLIENLPVKVVHE
jgi:hypothetical protein